MTRRSDEEQRAGSGTSGAAGASSVVDLARLAEITGGDPVLRRGLIDTFILAGEGALAAIETGLRASDRETICRAAHTLKGAAANMGAALLQQAAAALETAARAEPLTTLPDLAGALARDFAAARGVFEKERQRS
jgi:HPt (histidine-containing phosphotransfer) domain-containing protein